MNRNVVIKILSAMRPDGGPKPVYTATKKCEALDAAIAALRGSTREHPKGTLSAAVPPREQVEKAWMGCRLCEGAKYVTGTVSAVAPFDDQHETVTCLEGDFDFCPECGRPLTDEAVDMVMERLEALYGE